MTVSPRPLPLLRALSWLCARVIPALLLAAGVSGVLAETPPTSANVAPASSTQPTRERLGPGVEFIRDVRQIPRPLVIAVVEIDLKQPGLEFVVTPGEPSGGRGFRAQTTSHFLHANKLRLAINGGFFEPFKATSPFSYYPHEGDPVDVLGLCAARGKICSNSKTHYRALNISTKGEASLIDEPAKAYNAVSGLPLNLDPKTPPADPALHPRTAVAVDHHRHTLILMVVDGRQPGYSNGVTLAELAKLLADHGGDEALNLDGGGSTTMVSADAKGSIRLLNRPIHLGIPGNERPVANHLGLTWK